MKPKSTPESRFEMRKTAVDAMRKAEHPVTVARILGVSIRSVFLWLSIYRTGGYDALKDKPRSGRPRKVNADVMRWLYDAVTLGEPRQFQFEFCLWTLGIIRTMLKREKGIELSKSGVSRLLAHMGLTPQRPIFRSYKQDPEELDKFLKRTFPKLRELARKTGAVIYFVDEASIRSDAHRGTTWGISGITPIVEDTGDRFGLRLISAVSPRGDMKFATFEGQMTSSRFIGFLKDLRSDTGGPIIVIADNAGYHGSGKVRAFAAASEGQVVVEYLPRYAPELNPDEQVWNHAKARLSKLFIVSKDEWYSAVRSILRSIQMTPDLVRSFFKLDDTAYAAIQ